MYEYQRSFDTLLTQIVCLKFQLKLIGNQKLRQRLLLVLKKVKLLIIFNVMTTIFLKVHNDLHFTSSCLQHILFRTHFYFFILFSSVIQSWPSKTPKRQSQLQREGCI